MILMNVTICLNLQLRQPGKERQGGEDSRVLQISKWADDDAYHEVWSWWSWGLMEITDDVTVWYLKEAALEGKEMGSWNSLDHSDLQFNMIVYCDIVGIGNRLNQFLGYSIDSNDYRLDWNLTGSGFKPGDGREPQLTSSPGFCFFHLVRRFWNQILTWKSM